MRHIRFGRAMKRLLVMGVLGVMLLECACAEGVGTELWEREGGWLAFSVALSAEGTEEAWETGAEQFGASLGIPGMSGSQLKSLMLKGYKLEDGVDELLVEGNRFTGKTADGSEIFSHEYFWTETIEEEDVLGGTRVYLFQTEEAEAGTYACLMMTEPVSSGTDGQEYVTFNLLHSEAGNYRAALGSMLPETLIGEDTEIEGLSSAIMRLFSGPVTVR